MRLTFLATSLLVALTQSAAAEDGFYYGLGLGVTQSSADAEIEDFFNLTATNLSLALTAGYRIAQSKGLSYGIEGNLDVHTGKLMKDGPAEGCSNFTPSWCEINSSLRVRGTLSKKLAAGNTLMASLGFVVVSGRLEANPSDYRDSIGRGPSIGISWEHPMGNHGLRMDLNYDLIKTDNNPTYDRSLDMIGLRISYMF